MDLLCIFLNTKVFIASSCDLLAIHISSFEKCLFHFFAQTGFFFKLLNCRSSSYFLDNGCLWDIYFANIFWMIPLEEQSILILMKFIFLFFWWTGFTNFHDMKEFYVFFYKLYILYLAFRFRPVVYLRLIFVYGER